MATINRSAFILRPREPYLRWAAGLDEDAPAAAEALRGRSTVYLVPEDPEGEAETPPLEEYFEDLFELELAAWSEDEPRWPERRDLETFLEWFDVQGQSVVMDLGEDDIVVEDEDDDEDADEPESEEYEEEAFEEEDEILEEDDAL